MITSKKGQRQQGRRASDASTGFIIIRLVACLLLLSLSLIGCASHVGEGFALYEVAGEVRPSEVISIDNLQIAEDPLISTSDIVSYTRSSHTMVLTSEAMNRIHELDVPTSGRVFVVAVDRQPIYCGAFWTSLSSELFDGVIILIFPAFYGNSVQFSLGYPSELYFTEDDPRANPAIMQALERAGKLK